MTLAAGSRRGGSGPRRFVLGGALAGALACHPSGAAAPPATTAARPVEPPTPTSAPPRLPSELLSPPRGGDTSAGQNEPTVTINTGDQDVDVRTALQVIAQTGGFSLVTSPDVKKRVRLHLVDVPVSEALSAVLKAAGLTLATSAAMTVPWNTSVVFYQLPVNVDSLSVDAIMKRFGVGRGLAELIIEGRKRP